MDIPILINAIRMGVSIIYFKRSQVEISKLLYFSPRLFFILENSEYSDEMLHSAAFHLGLHCFSKYPF